MDNDCDGQVDEGCLADDQYDMCTEMVRDAADDLGLSCSTTPPGGG